MKNNKYQITYCMDYLFNVFSFRSDNVFSYTIWDLATNFMREREATKTF